MVTAHVFFYVNRTSIRQKVDFVDQRIVFTLTDIQNFAVILFEVPSTPSL